MAITFNKTSNWDTLSRLRELKKQKENKVKPLSMQGFYEYGTKPAVEQLKNTFVWVWSKTIDSAKWGIERIWEAGKWLASWKYNLDEALVRGVAWTAQTTFSPVAWILWQWIEETAKVIPQDFKDYVWKKAQPTIEDAKEWYNSQSPEQQRALNNIGVWVELLAEFAWAKPVVKWLEKTAEWLWKVSDNISDSIKNTWKWITNTVDAWIWKISNTKDDILNKLKSNTSSENLPWQVVSDFKSKKTELESWLTESQIKWLQSNPFQKEEFDRLQVKMDSPEGIDDIKNYKVERFWEITKELTDEIDKIKSSKWETSQAYKSIRDNKTPVESIQILDNIKQTVEKNGLWFEDGKIVRTQGIKAGELNDADVSKINQLYQDIQFDVNKGNGTLTPKQILDSRKTASSLAKYDGSSTTTGQNIVRQIRKDIDSVAKEKITWLKELDAQFVDKLDELENAIRDLVYKQWDVKWEWRSNIENIVSTLDRSNRARLSKRLDEVLPWIQDRVESINNLPSLYKWLTENALPDKLTSTGWAVIWATTLGSIVPWLWHIAWFILWYSWGKVAEQLFSKFRANAIKKILSEVSPEWKKKLKAINDKIEKNEKLSKIDNEFISNLKLKLENETSNWVDTTNANITTANNLGNNTNSNIKVPKNNAINTNTTTNSKSMNSMSTNKSVDDIKLPVVDKNGVKIIKTPKSKK